jgi:hypothetical protein
MITKEEIVRTVDELSRSELEQLAQYLAFIRYQSRIATIPSFDESQLAALYARFQAEQYHGSQEWKSDSD